eukprot:1016710-Rhodomonas_salina.2
MSGTDLAHGGTCLRARGMRCPVPTEDMVAYVGRDARYWSGMWWYMWYAMPGTDLARAGFSIQTSWAS